MKTTPSQSLIPSHRPGLTLLELSVTIMVALGLATVLFLGAKAWQRGSDRAQCVLQIRNMQVSVRSFSNMKGLGPGVSTAPISLENEIVGSGKFVEVTPDCPARGLYSMGGDTVPNIGSLYMTCSLEASNNHLPDLYSSW